MSFTERIGTTSELFFEVNATPGCKIGDMYGCQASATIESILIYVGNTARNRNTGYTITAREGIESDACSSILNDQFPRWLVTFVTKELRANIKEPIGSLII